MTLVPATILPSSTAPTQIAAPGRQDITTFLRGVPCDDTFWLGIHHRCAHCHDTGTTVCGALWRVSLADDCTELYFLHSRTCLLAYKRLHGLKSVEGRVALAEVATLTNGAA